MYKSLSNRVMQWIKKNKPLTADEEEIIAYGMHVFYLNVGKLIIIYLLAFIVGIVWQVFLVNVGFSVLRTVSYGPHAGSSMKCTIVMVCSFLGTAYIGLVLPYSDLLYAVTIPLLSLLLLFLYAPGETQTNPFSAENAKGKKKWQSIAMLVIVYLVSFVGYRDITSMISLGILLQCLTLSPFGYKFLK